VIRESMAATAAAGCQRWTEKAYQDRDPFVNKMGKFANNRITNIDRDPN
jgi:hypothetical protein